MALSTPQLGILIQMVEWNGILEWNTVISTINTRFNVLYCMGIKSVIASNNCTNSDAGMHQCDAVKGGVGVHKRRHDHLLLL